MIYGKNGHGKSNLLEAIYMLAIGKSPRANTDRDLIHLNSINDLVYAKIAAQIHNEEISNQLEIHYQCQPSDNYDKFTAQKFVRINGSPKRSMDLVGILNAVLFTVGDLNIIYGSPSGRRRYLDILLCQTNRDYLKSLQLYQKSNTQRNHLLRNIREGASSATELEFWDEQLSKLGANIIIERLHAIETLSINASQLHSEMSAENENMKISYRPSAPLDEQHELSNLQGLLRESLKMSQPKDISMAATSVGPHRDDIEISISGKEASRFASRGQSRTAVLSLRLSEAMYLEQQRGKKPILLLDDVFSELDQSRRALILDRISEYEQCIITTSDTPSNNDLFSKSSNKLMIENNSINEFTG